MDDRLVIENTVTTRYIAPVKSPDGEQQFEIAVGKNVSVSDTSGPLKFCGLVKPPAELRKD